MEVKRMTTLAGMDLGYGSQVKLVRTNFLFVEVAAAGTAQSLANVMHIYNRIQGEGSLLKADYIVQLVANAETAPTSGTTDPVVANLAASMLHPLVGPSQSHLATASGLTTDVSDTAARVGGPAGGSILAVLSTGLIRFEGTGFATPVKVELLAATVDHAEALNSDLLADSVGGPVFTVDMTLLAGEASSAGVLDTTGTLDLDNASLNAGFVMKGNAAGTAETTVADFTTPPVKTSALVSIVALVRTAQ